MSEGSSKNSPLAIALVILVGGASSGVAGVYLEKLRPETVPAAETPRPPPVSVETGMISIRSRPEGAMVRVNGEQIRLDTGGYAVTPIAQLTELQYGKQYTLGVELYGHRGEEVTFVMGPEYDRRDFSFTLEPRP